MIMRLGGMAKEMARAADTNIITHGQLVNAQGFPETGPEHLVAGLQGRFGPSEVETSIKTIIELLTFRRGHESIDEAIARFEVLQNNAYSMPGFEMPTAVSAWLFLEAMEIPRNVWPLLFNTFGGNLPTNAAQLHAMMSSIRQQGHIA